MSVTIETTEELLTLLRRLNVKVASVEELRSLLATINTHYNPQAARLRTAKLVAISVPCALGAIAGFVSFCLCMERWWSNNSFGSRWSNEAFVGAFAVVWGCCALVSVTALIFSFALLLRHPPRVTAEAPPPRESSAVEEHIMAVMTHDLSV